MPELVETQDEPVFDPVCVPLYFVSKLARESGVRVIQIGEGSDEIFVGYGFYLQAIRFAERLRVLRRLSPRNRDLLHGLVSPLLLAIGHRAEIWEELLRRVLYEKEVFWGGAILASDRQKAEMMPELTGRYSSWSMIERYYREIDERWPQADTVQRMTYIELRQRLPELLLARADKITMAASIEGREPFLAYDVVNFALRLPQAVKIRGGRTKAILRNAVADLIPADLLHRRKQGFPAPMSSWFLEEDLGRMMSGTLRTSPLVEEGYLDGDTVNRLAEEHLGRKRDHGTLLWTLLSMTLWYRRWIQGERIA
jgi:asparagine synthase (glutamine-hydrolysing)